MEAKVKAKKAAPAKAEAKAPAAPAKEAKKPAPKKKAPAKKVDPVKALLFKLKKIRIDRGLSAKDLAAKAGCSDSTIYSYERGDSVPKFTTFIKIVDALGYKIVLQMK